MLPDFSKYSLALVKDDKIVFSIFGSRLDPLIDAIRSFGKEKDLVLFDSKIGLAAARLIVHSQMFNKVFTDLASDPAVKLLNQFNIEIVAKNIIPNILRKDGSGLLCPMEEKALDMSNEQFFKEVII